MDLIILDITKFKNKIKVGNFVEVYNDKFTIDNFANLTGTIPYRIITCISKRYLRNYKINVWKNFIIKFYNILSIFF